MFSTDAMQYGTCPIDFTQSEGFPWVYPIRCGYHTAKTNITIDTEEAQLLVYVLKGEGKAKCGDKSCSYMSDCVITVLDGASLMLSVQEETEYLYLLLRNAQELLGQIGQNGFVQPVPKDSRADRLLGRLCYNIQTKQLGSIYAASADTYMLLMELCERCEQSHAQYSPLVRQAIEMIRQDYAFLSGIDELADTLGVTKSHLIRSFAASDVVSPGKYLQEVKVDNAKLMLQNRDYTIEMIANMVGYSGANYFCKVFRRVTGESPGEYRAQQLAPAALDLESKHRLEKLEGRYHI
ncbi:AraC family transcriptional regulator [Oscillospiraceae bacterium PP1C4]